MVIEIKATLIKIGNARIVEIDGEQYMLFPEPVIEHSMAVEEVKDPTEGLSPFEIVVFKTVEKYKAIGLSEIIAAVEQDYGQKEHIDVRSILQVLRKKGLIFTEGWGKAARWYPNISVDSPEPDYTRV